MGRRTWPLTYDPKDSIDSPFVQVMAYYRTSNEPITESMMTEVVDVTRPDGLTWTPRYFSIDSSGGKSKHATSSNATANKIVGCIAWMCVKKCSEIVISGQAWVYHETALTHWRRDKMAAVSQTTLSNAFSWMKMLEFRLRFYWSLFLRVPLTIIQHWFR